MFWMVFKSVVVEICAVCGPPARELLGESDVAENMDMRLAILNRDKVGEVRKGQSPGRAVDSVCGLFRGVMALDGLVKSSGGGQTCRGECETS